MAPSEDNKNRVSRRNYLGRLAGGAVTLPLLAGKLSAKGPKGKAKVIHLKGNANNPVDEKKIEKANRRINKKFVDSSSDDQQMGFAEPADSGGEILDYVLYAAEGEPLKRHVSRLPSRDQLGGFHLSDTEKESSEGPSVERSANRPAKRFPKQKYLHDSVKAAHRTAKRKKKEFKALAHKNGFKGASLGGSFGTQAQTSAGLSGWNDYFVDTASNPWSPYGEVVQSVFFGGLKTRDDGTDPLVFKTMPEFIPGYSRDDFTTDGTKYLNYKGWVHHDWGHGPLDCDIYDYGPSLISAGGGSTSVTAGYGPVEGTYTTSSTFEVRGQRNTSDHKATWDWPHNWGQTGLGKKYRNPVKFDVHSIGLTDDATCEYQKVMRTKAKYWVDSYGTDHADPDLYDRVWMSHWWPFRFETC